MITLRPAKSIQGKIALPVSPDLLLMAALAACAADRCIRISGVDKSDVIDDITRSLSGHATIELNDGVLSISPNTAINPTVNPTVNPTDNTNNNDPTILLPLPDSLIPYRVIYLFMSLGMGKTVVMKSATQMQLLDFTAQAKRVGITLESVKMCIGTDIGTDVGTDMDTDTSTPTSHPPALKATYFDSAIAKDSFPNEDDCAALLAFLFGRREAHFAFSITGYHLSTPLRKLAAAFGFALGAKLCTPEGEDDAMAKRLRFLQSKQRGAQAQGPGQTFIIETDFSARSTDASVALDIAVPGDEILAAALIAAKTIVSKGDLELTNVPLEPWAAQTISFVKKMGGKIDIKENAKTAFGSAGAVVVQKSECAGRKIRCIPMYQFLGHLPSITVAAAFAEGKSVFRDMAALRLFEPDGIGQLEQSLRPLGVRHGEMPDGIVVEGAKEFDGFDMLEALPAHIAVAFCAAGLRCIGKTSVADDFIVARWPKFEQLLNDICEFRNK